MVSKNSAAALQRKMQGLRRDLDEHANEMIGKARTEFGWRHFVARHPWATLGTVMAVGYWLVPRRARCKTGNPAAVTEATARAARAPSPLSDIAASVLAALTATAVREGLAFVAHTARKWLESRDEGVARPTENPMRSGENENDPVELYENTRNWNRSPERQPGAS